MTLIVKESNETSTPKPSEPIKISTPTMPTTDKRSEVTIPVYAETNKQQNENIKK